MRNSPLQVSSWVGGRTGLCLNLVSEGTSFWQIAPQLKSLPPSCDRTTTHIWEKIKSLLATKGMNDVKESLVWHNTHGRDVKKRAGCDQNCSLLSDYVCALPSPTLSSMTVTFSSSHTRCLRKFMKIPFDTSSLLTSYALASTHLNPKNFTRMTRRTRLKTTQGAKQQLNERLTWHNQTRYLLWLWAVPAVQWRHRLGSWKIKV